MATTQTSRIKTVDREEGLRLLDIQALALLGISAEEFIRRWDAGKYRDDPDRPEVMRVASLIGLAREASKRMPGRSAREAHESFFAAYRRRD